MPDKPELRREARRIRARCADHATAEDWAAASCHFFGGPLAEWHGGRRPVVAGYQPFGSEFDVRPLMNYLYEAGHAVALPVCDAVELAMHFRLWTPGMDLKPDAMGIMSPPRSAAPAVPDMVIVPLLAFTIRGDRVGYGSGYYDATLGSLRADGPVTAVGLAYAAQEVPEIVTDDFDQRLDWIVTESYARRTDLA